MQTLDKSILSKISIFVSIQIPPPTKKKLKNKFLILQRTIDLFYDWKSVSILGEMIFFFFKSSIEYTKKY